MLLSIITICFVVLQPGLAKYLLAQVSLKLKTVLLLLSARIIDMLHPIWYKNFNLNKH